MRLIDADALKEVFSDLLTEGYVATYGAVESRIALAPTIDAEPVKHGRWKHERLPSTSGGSYAVVRCSVCGNQYPMYETDYCPNCGARMDGDDNEID